MLNNWQKGSCQCWTLGMVTVDSRVWLRQPPRTEGYSARAGFCGQDVCRAQQLLCANAGGTAAMNEPKSHLKGTLCPTSNTWPCSGQLRNSSSSGSSSSNKWTAWPGLGGEGRNDSLLCRAGRQAESHKALSIAAATTSQELSFHVNNLDRALGHARVLSQLSHKKFICQCRRHRFDPWVRQMPWRRAWQPTLVENPHGQRGLAGYSPWGHKRVRHDLATKQQPQTVPKPRTIAVYSPGSGSI